ncbi:MAG: putative zinc-binding protein [Bacillota bacterium]|nr:putative zinc-binding protein [Bacillota bacterium]
MFRLDKGGTILVATCSGASNTGALAEEVAERVVGADDRARLVCLAAVAAGKESALKKVREAARIVVIEGCPMRCATEILRQSAGREPDIEVSITDRYGIQKESRRRFREEDAATIAGDIMTVLEKW